MNHHLLIFICLLCPLSLHAQSAPAANECDRLAAHPSDPDKTADGLESKDIEKDQAIAACKAALLTSPNQPRLLYQLGRVLFYDKQFDEGFALLRKSAELKHRQAQFVTGYLYVGGQPEFLKTPDYCQALPLWQDAAEHGHYASQVSVVRDYLRGKYGKCGVKFDLAKLRGYLAAANEQAKTYYERILIEYLQEQFADAKRR